MSTDLIIPNKPTFLAKADAPTTLSEFAGGVQSAGLALPVLSIRGKMFRARLGGEETVLTKDRELQVILVAARPHVSKRYYDSAYQAGSVEAPACAAVDGKTPTQGDRKQSASCATCPHNVFGSKGKGKACNDYKRVIVLPLVNGKPVNTPCVLDIPATSLRTPKELRGGTDKMLAEYLGALSRHQIDPTTVVSTISFTGAEHPQLCWSLARYVDETEHNFVQTLRDDDDVHEALGDELDEVPGPIAEAAAPVVAPVAEQPVEVKAAPKQEPKAAPAQVDIEEAIAATPEPKAEPAPAPVVAEAPKADDDLMADIEKLLGGLK